MYLVAYVRPFVCMSNLSRLNRLTYDLDIQYLGRPEVQTDRHVDGQTDTHTKHTPTDGIENITSSANAGGKSSHVYHTELCTRDAHYNVMELSSQFNTNVSQS